MTGREIEPQWTVDPAVRARIAMTAPGIVRTLDYLCMELSGAPDLDAEQRRLLGDELRRLGGKLSDRTVIEP